MPEHHTHVDEAGVVAVLQVVQYRRLVEAGELRHVLHLVELGRIHLLDIVLVHRDLLAGVGELHDALLSLLLLDGARFEARPLRGHPYQLLGSPVSLLQGVVDRIPINVKKLLGT